MDGCYYKKKYLFYAISKGSESIHFSSILEWQTHTIIRIIMKHISDMTDDLLHWKIRSFGDSFGLENRSVVKCKSKKKSLNKSSYFVKITNCSACVL